MSGRQKTKYAGHWENRTSGLDRAKVEQLRLALFHKKGAELQTPAFFCAGQQPTPRATRGKTFRSPTPVPRVVRDWMKRMGDIPENCFSVLGAMDRQPIASNDLRPGKQTISGWRSNWYRKLASVGSPLWGRVGPWLIETILFCARRNGPLGMGL